MEFNLILLKWRFNKYDVDPVTFEKKNKVKVPTTEKLIMRNIIFNILNPR